MKSWQKNLAAALFGLLLITLIELALRFTGFHPAACSLDPFVSFKEDVPVLVEANYQGLPVVTINPRLNSYFNPVAFPKDKPPGTRRIFVLGGSDVMGFPFGARGAFTEFLSQALKELDHSHSYQVINLGGFGYASYRVERVFRDALHFSPDLVIIMTGHNEFLEKREYSAPEKLTRIRKKLSQFKIYCLLKTVVFKIHPPAGKPLIATEVKWEHFTLDPVMRERIIAHYQFNLQKMAQQAREQKVPALFLTLPSNLKDFPPFHSEHKPGISSADLAEWEKNFRQAQELMAEKNFGEAVQFLQLAAAIDPDYGMGWYLLGRALLATGSDADARAAFEFALEKDSWQVRALPEFNKIIRGLKDQAHVLDLVPLFDAVSPANIPGDNLFLDHCHPRLETQALIAKEILRKLNQDKLLSLPRDWENVFDQSVKTYIDSLPPSFLAAAYYRLAVETGINMGLKDLGRKYLELGLALEPDNPKLKALAPKLK